MDNLAEGVYSFRKEIHFQIASGGRRYKKTISIVYHVRDRTAPDSHSRTRSLVYL